jgi:hypothetical protein
MTFFRSTRDGERKHTLRGRSQPHQGRIRKHFFCFFEGHHTSPHQLRASDMKRTICIMQRIQLVRDNIDYGQLPTLTYQDSVGPWSSCMIERIQSLFLIKYHKSEKLVANSNLSCCNFISRSTLARCILHCSVTVYNRSFSPTSSAATFVSKTHFILL